MATDASGVGIGAVCGHNWFSVDLVTLTTKLPWLSESLEHFDINFWEFFALFAAVLTWGHMWRNKQVLIYVDNLSLTHICIKGSKSPNIMRLLRQLFFFTANHNINLMVQHIPGQVNIVADLLSRLQVQQFKDISPEAATNATPLADHIWDT